MRMPLWSCSWLSCITARMKESLGLHYPALLFDKVADVFPRIMIAAVNSVYLDDRNQVYDL